MKKTRLTLWLLAMSSAILLSIPWLVPHTGIIALVGFVPLLCAEEIATGAGIKRFWIWHYSTFVVWNALTTFWVCNATVGGGIFAVLANALQMSLVFGLFRLSRRHLGGSVPYIFLAVTWIAWERWYLTSAQISWPWLVLGNAFAQSTSSVQWYSITGTLGGSLWVWAANLSIYGMLACVASGRWHEWLHRTRVSAAVGTVLVLAGPLLASSIMYGSYREQSEGKVDVLIGQPNFDPYQKFTSMTQSQQNDVLLDLYSNAIQPADSNAEILFLAPETFTGGVVLDHMQESISIRAFEHFLQGYPNSTMLFGASTYEIFNTRSAPSLLATPYGDGWICSHNSAMTVNAAGSLELYHKSKLVVGTELTPYPKVFVPLDDWLCRTFKVPGPMMARCIGQDEVSLLHMNNHGEVVPLGCAVCYESVYGEYCTEYVRKGARAMTVITNDAWWGDTPGYRQHLSYSRLRAIELRRDIARCGNTGISCFIDQKGDILSCTDWWQPATLRGSVNLNSRKSFFAEHGDMVGRVCTLAFLLLLALVVVRLFMQKRK